MGKRNKTADGTVNGRVVFHERRGKLRIPYGIKEEKERFSIVRDEKSRHKRLYSKVRCLLCKDLQSLEQIGETDWVVPRTVSNPKVVYKRLDHYLC